MTIAIASDHAALKLKSAIVEYLTKKGLEVVDLGPQTEIPCDYPDYAEKVAKKVQKSSGALVGILICGTGIGMSITANKFKGIRAAVCSDTFSARMTRLHNDANILSIGERVVGLGLALDIVDAFITTEFSSEERHQKRVDKITKLEK
ncbi:MAG: ribose 5-phosphate isomerase B [Firmicutes bacterium]|nr:ribose 5-phosphate isomerase B [Bacillota bacterium]